MFINYIIFPLYFVAERHSIQWHKTQLCCPWQYEF